ncbi:MAG: RluA family pseudouridine synthase [Pseudomonadota bacterium]
MDVRTLEATETDAGERVDRVLAAAMGDLSRSRVKALIKAGALSCDGAALVDPNAPVRAGALYALEIPDPVPATPEPEAIALEILYEDADLIVVNKAAGMAVHPAPGSWQGTLVNALLHHCEGRLPGIGGVERPGIVHRIDKDTTGVMVVAKSEGAHAGLTARFAAHDMERAYLAVTRGAPRPLVGTVDAAIARSTADRKKMSVVRAPRGRDPIDTKGRHAVTHYKVERTFGVLDKGSGLPAAALIGCRLETGRTHQIRVHMGHIGAPLIGDPVYGRNRGIKAYGSGDAFIAATSAARAFPRQALHAAVLGFDHPVTGAALRFEAPLPGDMQALLDALEAMPG